MQTSVSELPRAPGAIALALTFLGCLLAAHPTRAAGAWSGTWDTVWRTGEARMVLEQDGDRVVGTYMPRLGSIDARVEGNALVGVWREPTNEGSFRFVMAPDGASFVGNFGSGEWWNGGRVSSTTRWPDRPIELETPAAALRTFLINFNSLNSGDLRRAATLLAPLDFQRHPGATELDRLALANLLFGVVDLTTMRIFDARARDGARQAAFTVGQAGTDNEFTLEFARGDDDQWRLVVPERAVLDVSYQAMRDARGIREPDPLAYRALGNPRATMQAFLEGYFSWHDGGRRVATAAMDLSELEPAIRDIETPLLAEYLKQVLDRIGYVVWQEIPDDPDSRLRYVHFEHPLGRVEIVRNEIGGGEPPVWQFSAATLDQIVPLLHAFDGVDAAEGVTSAARVSAFFTLRGRIRDLSPGLTVRDGPMERWQWLAVLLIAVTGPLIAVGVTRWVIARMRRRAARNPAPSRPLAEVGSRIRWPLMLSILAFIWINGFSAIGLPPRAIVWLRIGADTLLAIAVGWFLIYVVERVSEVARRRADGSDGVLDDIFVSFVSSVAKVVIVVAALMKIADTFGIPYTTIVTGLGIGGLALAIAARDTIANFFGSATLLADRPFRRGERVNFGEHKGVVEKVGLRSTRIRTLDDSLLIIPNNELANQVIDNRGVRRARRVLTDISVTYDTPREQLETFVAAIRDLVQAHPRVQPDNVFVAVWQFAESSIDIRLWCLLRVANRAEEFQERHALMLEIMQLAEQLEIEFAFPTRTLYLNRDGGGEVAPQ